MARKTKFITSTLALLIGIFIFGTSLIMASQVRSNESPRVSERKFYIGKRILPDHVLYPLLMVADRIILETSFGDRRVYVRMRLADDRLNSSRFLIEKGQEELALSTMTKSQKYLITATQDFLNNDKQTESVRSDLVSTIKRNSYELKRCRDEFEVVNTTQISDLIEESSFLITQLN